MAILTPLSKSVFTVKINNLDAAGYDTTGNTNPQLTTYIANASTAAIAGETNFLVSGDDNTVINGSLTISIDQSTLSDNLYLGFRLFNATGNSNFTFTTTDDTTFNVPQTSPYIADSATTSTIIWTNNTIANTAGTITIPVEVAYAASTKTPGDTVTFTVELFENSAASNEGSSFQSIGTVDRTTDSQTANLTVTVYTGVVSSAMTSHSPEALNSDQNTFYRNNPIALKTLLTTTNDTYYKPATALTITLTVPTAIPLSMLYVTTSSQTTISNIASDTDNTVAIDLTGSLTDTGITIITVDTNNIVSIAMPTGVIFDKVFDNGALKSPVQVYVTGTVS